MKLRAYVESRQEIAINLEGIIHAAFEMHNAQLAPAALGELLFAAWTAAGQLNNALDLVNLPEEDAA